MRPKISENDFSRKRPKSIMLTVQVGAQGAYAPTEFWGKEI